MKTQLWNPRGATTVRSALDCGGKRSATPLLPRTGTQANEQNEDPSLRFLCCLLLGTAAQKRRRRCALPAHFKTWRAFAAALCLLAAPLFSHAQSYSVDWFTIDGGGGTSTGGVYSLSGTIGQPDANAQPLAGGNFSLIGGFWSLLAVPTPGAPLLTIQLSTTNTAIISWPSPSAGFTLQQNSDLSTTNWIAAPQPVTDNGTNKFILVDPPTGNRFYRLFKP